MGSRPGGSQKPSGCTCVSLPSELSGWTLTPAAGLQPEQIEQETINKAEEVVINRLKVPVTYSFDGQHQTSISEEDGDDRNKEVAGKHVYDI